MKYYFYNLTICFTDGTDGECCGLSTVPKHSTPNEAWDKITNFFIGKEMPTDNDPTLRTVKSIQFISFYRVE